MPVYQWLSLLLGLAVVIIGAAWNLRGRLDALDGRLARVEGRLARLDALDSRLARVESHLARLHATVRALVRVAAIMVGGLQRSGALSPDDTRDIVAALGTLEETVASGGNPVTSEERGRLLKYISMARQGESFTKEEARDFYLLSDRLNEEKPEDPGSWNLLILGAMVFGMSLGKKGGDGG